MDLMKQKNPWTASRPIPYCIECFISRLMSCIARREVRMSESITVASSHVSLSGGLVDCRGASP